MTKIVSGGDNFLSTTSKMVSGGKTFFYNLPQFFLKFCNIPPCDIVDLGPDLHYLPRWPVSFNRKHIEDPEAVSTDDTHPSYQETLRVFPGCCMNCALFYDSQSSTCRLEHSDTGCEGEGDYPMGGRYSCDLLASRII